MAGTATAGAAAAASAAISPKLPLLTRLAYAAIAFALQNFLVAPTILFMKIRHRLKPPRIRPNIVKTYPCRPRLPVRIFFPTAYDPAKPRELPILFTIHGGGFVLGTPNDTDRWNYQFCNTHGALVVALNYAKAPANPFPGPIHDVGALLLAVLDDPALSKHIDADRVALLGWSAGASLTLAAAQMPQVRSRLAAIVPMYPAADVTVGWAVKEKLRRYKPELGGLRARPHDYLAGISKVFTWAYVPTGQDLRDPQISPFFAQTSALPPRVFVVGCELDLLSHEAWRLASRLAGRPVPAMDEVVGRQALTPKGKLVKDDEIYHWEVQVAPSTEEGGDARERCYKWLLVPDSVHGFDMEIQSFVGNDPAHLADMKAKTAEVIGLIGDWLWK
ncbi:alpha/beta hydrolase fold protein [Gaeumannomyces tritici R3-111a-1]|uniref:Alpha/beta hydrolase fold protein n=1 Tax=Gaeumannomyces tritici (strain R3-111a-1) TaxID=644352 RepID=J3P4Z9_GAET3|nr:alpha/beta hydrolase fold protein [Gaeumannomyces tritici R3-111a-1]EJT74747.1 alpha/beta hydrolase fold protein [Gaeumannomyces tritici R3-111a-1]